MFQIEFQLHELQFLRGALDAINIPGKDAKYLANLQSKLENEISDIQRLLAEQNEQKNSELQDLIASENNKK